MRLGTILGGKAWADLNAAAREKRQSDKAERRESFARKQRRAVLNSLGFVPIKTKAPAQAWWGAE